MAVNMIFKSSVSLHFMLIVAFFTIGYRMYFDSFETRSRLCRPAYTCNYIGRTIPFFDTTFNPIKNPFFSTYEDFCIPSLAEAYQTSFCCAIDPRRGRGLKVSSTPFLGFPKGRLPLFIIVNLLAGDINLNPGPTQFVQCSDDDVLSTDESVHIDSTGSSSQHKKQGLNVLYFNACSIKTVTRKKKINKLRDFSFILAKKLHDIICITETWLNSNVSDAELSNSDYTMYRKDRPDYHEKTRGGGLLCAIKTCVMSLRRN